MKLKICGNTRPENIEALLEICPDYLGFIFYPHSKRYIGNDDIVKHYIASLRGAEKVGVFVNASIAAVCQHIKDYRLDVVQLHGTESPEYCSQISRTVPVIKAFGMDSGFDTGATQAYESCCSYFLFDTAHPGYGGSGQAFDWSVLHDYKGSTKFFLSGGISMDHLPAIRSFRHPSFAGIDVNSRFELSPGVKNIHSLKTFNHALRNQQ